MTYTTYEHDSVTPSLGAPFFTEHLARYLFAKGFAKGKRVLDLGCGKGYGSAILSEVASQVIGMDLNPESIKFANQYYGRPNTRFAMEDASNFKGEPFDLIVSFEVLEHLPSQQVPAFLSSIKRNLTTNGIFIISTPNHDVVIKSGMPIPEFHIFNLTPRELRSLLREYFSIVNLYGQAKKRGFLKDRLLDLDILNFRHSKLLRKLLRSLKRNSAPQDQLTPTGEIWTPEKGWGDAPEFRFKEGLWRQAGMTLAICSK